MAILDVPLGVREVDVGEQFGKFKNGAEWISPLVCRVHLSVTSWLFENLADNSNCRHSSSTQDGLLQVSA